MDAYFIMFGGILLFVTVIGLLDIIGRRRDRDHTRASHR